MALMQVEFVKDQFIYMPQMGMYWQIYGLKRVANEDDTGYWLRSKAVNDQLQKIADANNEYHPCLFLLASQVYALPETVRKSLAALSYLMVADPQFSGVEMPDHAEWNPVDFVWKSNRNVLMNQYRGTNEHAAEWMSHRFKVVPENEVKALTDFPSGAYDPWAVPSGNTGGDTQDDTTGDTTAPSGGLVLHMNCPHCGKKIF